VDPLTHTLAAVLIGRAVFGRLAPGTVILLAAGANLPDLDLLAGAAGLGSYLSHRGPAHSFILAPVLALALTGAVALFQPHGVAWRTAWPAAFAGVLSNPLLDALTPHGVQLLWPFTGGYFHLDLAASIDLWIWAILLFGLLWPWFSRLVSSEIGERAGTGRGAAIAALALFTAYCGGRYLLHERALAILESHLYHGEIPRTVAALPAPVNPFRWVGVVEGRTFSLHLNLNLLEEFDPLKPGTVINYKVFEKDAADAGLQQ